MAAHHLKKGTLWTIAYFLGSFAKTIVLTPMMLSHWGARVFCFWAVLLSARAVFLFLSDGFVRYVVNAYNIGYHTDEAAAARILSSGHSFSSLFTVLLSCTAFAALSLQPGWCAALFNVPVQDVTGNGLPLYVSLYLLVCGVQNGQRMYAAAKEARGLVWHNLFLEVLLVGLEIALLAGLLAMGGSFSQVVGADIILIALVTLAYQVYLSRLYPLPQWLTFRSIKQGWRSFREAGRLYAGNFFEKLSTDGIVIMLSLFHFSKQSVALFSTLRTMVNAPLLAQNLLLNTYTPRLQQLFALKDAALLSGLLQLVRRYLGTLLLAAVIVCVPLYEPVFLYWTRHTLPFEGLFVAEVLVWCVWCIYGNGYLFVLKGLNHLSVFMQLMALRCALLIAGLWWSGGNLLHFGSVLVSIEFLFSGILTPVMLLQFWKKRDFNFNRRSDWLLLFVHIFASGLLFYFLV